MVSRGASAMLVLALLAASATASAQPAIERPVTDAAGVLGDATIAAIEERLHAHHDAGRGQIALLVVATLEGQPITDYALRAAERWRGGSEARDDGALFVLATQDREMRIEVGYGLEEAIPDTAAMQILDGLVPHLRARRFDAAAWAVADALIVRTGGASEPFPPALAAAATRDGEPVPSGRPRHAYTVPADDGFARDAEADRAWAEEQARSSLQGFGLLAFVVLMSLLVFVYLWRQSSVAYDRDGRRIDRPLGEIFDDVRTALESAAAESGGGAGGGGGHSRGASDSHRSHRRERSHGGSSGSGGSHRSYGGGGGGFGGGGASKRW